MNGYAKFKALVAWLKTHPIPDDAPYVGQVPILFGQVWTTKDLPRARCLVSIETGEGGPTVGAVPLSVSLEADGLEVMTAGGISFVVPVEPFRLEQAQLHRCVDRLDDRSLRLLVSAVCEHYGQG